MTELPIIDVGGLRGGGSAAKAKVAAQLREACLTQGFFYITDHGVPLSEMDAVTDWSRRLFALPDTAKAAIAYSGNEGDHGYADMAHGTVPSTKEEYYATRERPAGETDLNRWPADLPGFREVMLCHVERMHDVAALLMTGLAISLDLAKDHFDAFCTDPIAALRLVRYSPKAQGANPHTDFGSLTLLLQDENDGLQVLDRANGGWIDAPPIRGTFVVNVGDLFERWTNGHYRSTLHRVVIRNKVDRFTAPFFLTGAANHPIACLPSCLKAGETPLYPATTVVEHLRARFAQQAP